MDWNRSQIKQRLAVVCGGVAFFCALQNLPALAGALRWVLGVLGPFLVGGAIAWKTTVMTTAIMQYTNQGNFSLGIALGIILMAVSLLVNIAVSLLQRRLSR